MLSRFLLLLAVNALCGKGTAESKLEYVTVVSIFGSFVLSTILTFQVDSFGEAGSKTQYCIDIVTVLPEPPQTLNLGLSVQYCNHF